MEKTAIKKILVVVLDNIGDAVMATALLRPLRRRYPQAQIGLWTKDYPADLFQDQSLIDFHHYCDPFWDKSPGREKGSLKKFWDTFCEIRRAKYEMVYVLNAEWRRSLMVWLAGIPERIGLNRRKSRFFLTRAIDVAQGVQHFVEDHLLLIAHENEDCFPRLELSSEEKRQFEEWSRKTKWEPKSYLVIHPFSGDALKTWPLVCWTELLQSLFSEKKVSRFVILCGPGEEARLHQMVTNLPSAPIQILAGGRLSTVKAILAHSAGLVGGDSGPGHIAAALGVPVLSLFGNTNPLRSRPIGHGYMKTIYKNPIHHISVSEVRENMGPLLEDLKAHV